MAKGITEKGITAVIGLSLMFLLPASGAKSNNSDNERMKERTVVQAKALYDIFKINGNNNSYVGNITTVTGFVVYTGPDIYALPSIELSEAKGGRSRLLCVLPFSDYLKLRKVSKGDRVIIRGEVRGFYEKGDQVLMKQCIIVDKDQ